MDGVINASGGRAIPYAKGDSREVPQKPGFASFGLAREDMWTVPVPAYFSLTRHCCGMSGTNICFSNIVKCCCSATKALLATVCTVCAGPPIPFSRYVQPVGHAWGCRRTTNDI